MHFELSSICHAHAEQRSNPKIRSSSASSYTSIKNEPTMLANVLPAPKTLTPSPIPNVVEKSSRLKQNFASHRYPEHNTHSLGPHKDIIVQRQNKICSNHGSQGHVLTGEKPFHSRSPNLTSKSSKPNEYPLPSSVARRKQRFETGPSQSLKPVAILSTPGQFYLPLRPPGPSKSKEPQQGLRSSPKSKIQSPCTPQCNTLGRNENTNTVADSSKAKTEVVYR